MDLINLPRLRMKELQTVGENSLRICRNITELQPAVDKVKITLKAFKQGMLKEKVSADSKTKLDKERDRLVSGLMHELKAEQCFPYQDDAEKNIVTQLTNLSEKYGFKINKLRYSEETAAIDNLLAELKSIDISVLSNDGIARWIPLMENANNAFKEANSTWLAESAQIDTVESASTLAPGLIADLEGRVSN